MIKNIPVEIPASIAIALKNNPHKGVCVVYQNDKDKTWSTRAMQGAPISYGIITSIIKDNQFNENSSSFAIIDYNGNLCYSNSDTMQITKDANGYIHVNNNEYLIKIIDDPKVTDTCCFAPGKDISEINRCISRRIDNGFMYRPSEFGQKGFTSFPIFEKNPTEMAD